MGVFLITVISILLIFENVVFNQFPKRMSNADLTPSVHLTRPVNSRSVKIRASSGILAATMPFVVPNSTDPSVSVRMAGVVIHTLNASDVSHILK